MRNTNGVDFYNGMRGGRWGNANTWDDNARRLGYRVDGAPARGAIAQTDAGAYGHVAWVDAVNGDGSVTIEEYNYGFRGSFGRRVVPAGAFRYIHVNDLASWPPAEGSFVSTTDNGEVYRIAGGSPQYVSTWNIYGGGQPTVHISRAQLNSLPRVPRDGTFVHGLPSGRVFRVVGGAPLYVSNWASIGGAQSTVGIDDAAIDRAGQASPWNHLNPVPTDMFLRGLPSQRIFRVVGGHAYHVTSWEPYGGVQPFLDVDDWAIDNCDHLNCNPMGSLDGAGGEAGVVRLLGWAMDPNVTTPVAIHVYSDGAFAGSLAAANVSRPDVDRVFHRGAEFGYDFKVPLTAGDHNVCVYAINVGASNTNPQLGCAAVKVQDRPVTPEAPSRLDSCGASSDQYTIPATEGVEYLVGDEVKEPGSHPTGGVGSVVVTARVKPGYVLSGTDSWTLSFDTEDCAAKVIPSAAVATGPRVSVKWSASGVHADSFTYTVEKRLVTVSSTGTKIYSTPATWLSDTSSTSAVFSGEAGASYQVRVQAKDTAGAVSPWTNWATIAMPCDDQGLSVSGAWTSARASSTYMGTYRSTNEAGAAASLSGYTDQITLIGAKGPSSGKAKLYVDGVYKKTLDTYASVTAQRQLLATVSVPYGIHTVRIENVATPDRPTLILDGIRFR